MRQVRKRKSFESWPKVFHDMLPPFLGENLKISQAMSYKTRKVHPSASQGKAEEQTSKEECLAGELHVSARIRLFFAFPQLVRQESETNCQTWIGKSARGRKADSTYL